MADTPSLRYLKEFRDRGFNQNTVLFFISDHGLRWGAFRSTYAGMLEERMPFLFAVFPPWFKEEYPDVWRNMKKNTKRLTSTFDLHATLFDILNRAYANMTRTYSGAHGISLFREVPLNRTCEDASIPEHYCACEHSVDADPRDPKLKEVAEFSVSKLNSGLKKFPQCVQLELDEVISGRTGSARNSTTPKGLKTIISTYMVTFQTKPGGARLEATVREHDGTFELVADVSRTNKYGDQSHCVKDFWVLRMDAPPKRTVQRGRPWLRDGGRTTRQNTGRRGDERNSDVRHREECREGDVHQRGIAWTAVSVEP
ncbi:hypothetical protein C7M84_024085 [Penaeus vannamei]|uniref:Uncharacterized protein n=1 Tax=Penaeus vannamei TaxID=6689 RepID=A0A423U221_PENVA|nr:hypothetical protein C7M84_024085 [Penaeus vannamei]